MLLEFFDAFSKWVDLVPLRKATSAHLEKSFRERILNHFGVPRVFVCDNGNQFTSRSFKAFCKQAEMEIQYTAPYTPQQNSTERANRTIKTMVAQNIEEKHATWDVLLPELNLAINSSVLDSTGFSPAFIVHGMEPRLPGAL